MTVKKTKENKRNNKQQPTIMHESSADNAQDLGIKISEEEKNEKLNLSHRKGHSGSDGANGEESSNH